MAKKTGLTIEARFRILLGGKNIFGPGKAELLDHILRTGSITEAAKAMDMSYMRAWTLVKAMNHGWREPLVVTTRGGNQRGGASVSETGREVLTLYREIEADAEKGLSAGLARLRRMLRE